MPLTELQQQTIDLVKSQLDLNNPDRAKFIFIDAPTGAGKSLINLFSAKGKTAYVTTPQRILVKQYLESIKNVPIYKGLGVGVMGKATYKCIKLSTPEKFENCDGAPCIEKVEGENKMCDYYANGCYYYDAVRKAQREPVTITSLAYCLMAIKRGIENHAMLTKEEAEMLSDSENELKGWFKRDVLIIDEAHSFDDAIVNFFTVDLTPFSFDQQLNFEALVEKIDGKDDTEIRNIIMEHVSEIIRLTKDRLDIEEDESIKKTLRTRIERMSHLVVKLNFDTTYIIQKSDTSINLKPYSPAPFIKNFLYSFDNVIFSSATFVNLEQLTKSLGIEPNDWVSISVPSTFDAKRAPIVFDSVGKINKESLSEALPKVAKAIDDYANLYADERILVHCHSYPIQTYLIENISESNRPRLISHTPKDREYQEKVFEYSKKGIFLSVNMTEGLDLKDDLCRIQIIVKCPYLNLGDKWIKEHYNRDGRAWYETKTLSTIIQACGRIIRSKDDWGVTVILDANAFYLIEKYKDREPESFKQRLRR